MYQQQQRDPRGQYIPPPPPLTPAQSHGPAYLPPPPPRPMPSMNHGHNHGPGLPPPPPGGPQGLAYWNRQQYPPPPPPPLQGPVAPYNPGAYGAYGTVQTPIEPPEQPLTSATYYPSGESFGPGVGIPPLDPSGVRPSLESYYSFEDAQRAQRRPDATTREREREELTSAGFPNTHSAAGYGPASNLHYQQSAVSRSPNQNVSRPPEAQGASNAAPLSPRDPGVNWPMDTVLAWLSSNSFSDDWLRTFSKLSLYGSKFLDLGRGHGGRGNLNVLHTDIYPRLAKECTSSGTGWDQHREREEGKRLRKLIRQVVDDEGPPVVTKGRRPSFINPNESQDGSTPSTAGGNGGESPGFHQPTANTPAQTIAQRRESKRKAKTPTPTISPAADTNPPKPALPDNSNATRALSPATIRDGATRNTSHRLELAKAPREQSPQLGPIGSDNRPQSGKTSGPPSAAAVRYYGHQRARSSGGGNNDLTGLPASPSPSLFASHDHRRNGADVDRSPSDSAKVAGVDNPPASAKESRSFFSKITGRRKDGHSPVSPVGHRIGFHRGNSSETSLDKPYSVATDIKKNVPTPKSSSYSQERFVMITPDGWNYRLLDVSEIDSLDTFHEVIRYNLNLPNAQELNVFITAPGQSKHDELLSGAALQSTLKSAGPDGILKLFVQGPSGNLMAPTRDATFPVSTGSLPVARPPYQSTYGKLVAGDADIASGSSPGIHSLSPDEDEKTDPSEAERRSKLELDAAKHRQEMDRKQKAYFEAREARYKRNPIDPHASGGPKTAGVYDFDEPRQSPSEEKRNELVPKRAPPPAPPESNTMMKANSLSKRAQGSLRVVDTKRRSGESYDGSLRTRRKPPAEQPIVASGIASTTTGAGQMISTHGHVINGSIENNHGDGGGLQKSMSALGDPGTNTGKRISPGGSPKSPGFTMSKGNIPFKIPEYSDALSGPPYSTLTNTGTASTTATTTTTTLVSRPSMHARLPSNPNIEKLKSLRPGSAESVEGNPATSPQPPTLSRRSTRGSRHGPTLDFTEHHVSFDRAADATPEVSDEDSDNDLFAVPLRGQTKGVKEVKASSDDMSRPDSVNGRPSLTIQTPSTKLVRSVSFDTARNTTQSASQQVSPSDDTRVDGGENAEPQALSKSAGPPETPEHQTDEQKRRISVFDENEDGWANRPQAELLIDDLDKFFPHVDLDQPIIDENGSPPASPTLQRHSKNQSAIDDTRGKIQSGQETEIENADTLHTLKTVATRNVRKSTRAGLSRTKSIREVVKDAYQQPTGAGGPGLQRHPTVKSGSILRRKSTKVFGAIATEVKPRNSKIGMLETIPQDSIAIAPRRQATFKWMKGQLIGKGTFGRVYLGMNIGTGELLAVKQVEVNPNKAGQDKEKVRDMVRALDQEIDTMQHLDHENIVQYLGCERKEYSISIFLEYISGGSVGSCYRKHGKFEETVVSSLTRQVLNGLAYLHHEGILHRDLKADNILLDLDGVCKISDFGISKKTDNIYGNDATNSMQGSVFWMAPEVVRSQGEGYSAKVDIWSLGCVVLEMFQGKRPFAGDELVGAIFKLGSLNQPPPIPDEVSKIVSPAALSFMFDCWNNDPADRPTAETLLRAPFAFQNGDYNWYDTTLYEKIKMPTTAAEPRMKGANNGDAS